MYGCGFELPQFALFPLLDNPAAVGRLKTMYQAVMDVGVRHGMGVLIGGLDYRASPDWAALLGFDKLRLAEYQMRSIAFLRSVSEPYRERLPHLLVAGIVGPQGDAYERNPVISASSAETYHSEQMKNLAAAGVDLVQAMTFTSFDEAEGVIRAARTYQLPVVLSFMPDGSEEFATYFSFKRAVEQLDIATERYALFYGINCSHPAEFVALLGEEGQGIDRVRLLRPNASARDKIELCQIGHLERGDPLDLADRIGTLSDKLPHLTVFGGCCGTWDEHLHHIAAAVQKH
jgi:S-methylmethionine-dependent homocysteine/selenocysteine methylase